MTWVPYVAATGPLVRAARLRLACTENDPDLTAGIHDEVPAINALCYCKTLDGLIAGGEADSLLCVAGACLCSHTSVWCHAFNRLSALPGTV